ncbi:hypothetical protein MC77_020455 [Citrobacter koseri]|nr:hypothetical protein MC77_020455 [Citrobacter koseri]
MGICAVCECSLNDSQDVVHKGVDYKSCPKCSADAGVHVFYKTEDFGYRDMGDGRHIVQSWCPSCRSGDNPSIPEAFRCK